LTVIALAGCLGSVTFRIIESRFSAAYQARATESARMAVFQGWFGAHWEDVRLDRLGRLQQLVGLSAQQAAVPVQLFSTSSVSLVGLVIYTVIIVVTAPFVAALFALVGLTTVSLFAPIRRQQERLSRRHTAEVGDLQLAATSYAHLSRELHVYGVGAAAEASLGAQTREVGDNFRRLRGWQRMLPGLQQQAFLAAIVAVIALGRTVGVEAASFGTAVVLALRSLSYVEQLNMAAQGYIEARPYLEELSEAISHHHDMHRVGGESPLGRIEALELRDAGYEYEPGVPVLADVNLVLRSGERLGIIGPSGAGKTTLVNLLCGLLTPSAGQLLANGRPAAAYTAASWAAEFGLLSQEPALLRDTVAGNIAFRRPAGTDDIVAAARSAAVYDEVADLPQGLQTPVGDGHSSLSVGQRQRIALARALLRRPSCLILDEPTSALDSANEQLIDECIRRLPPDTIVVVVSHRPALLRQCDRFIAVDPSGSVSTVEDLLGGDLVEGLEVTEPLQSAQQARVVLEPEGGVAVVQGDGEEGTAPSSVDDLHLPNPVGEATVEREVVDQDGDLDDPFVHPGLGYPE